MSRFLILCMSVLWLSSFSSHAIKKPKECRTPLKLSLTSDWFPYVEHRNDYFTTGIDVELLKTVLRSMQCDLQIVHFPERRTLFELSIGHFDIGLGASMTPERAERFYFSKAYRLERNRLAYRVQDTQVKNSFALEQLIAQKKLIGINLAGWYGEELEQAKRVYNGFIFSETAAKRLKMLSLNRVDIVIDDDVVLCSEIVRQKHKNLIVHPMLLSQADIHFIFNKQSVSNEFMERFNFALQTVLASGALQSLYGDYISQDCFNFLN